MNLAIITTIGINAGDNFIYEGFKALFPTKHYGSVFLIDKTSIPKDKKGYRELIDESDLIVICGSPIFYQGCYKMKWQNKVLEYARKSGKKILLFAVGSNFTCSADGIVSYPDTISDRNYADFVSQYKEVLFGNFTVRDRHCRKFLNGLGVIDVRQVVCPSFFAGNENIVQKEHDLLFIIWGSSYWSSETPPQKVLGLCKQVANALAERFTDKRIVWVCHDIVSYKWLLDYIDRHDILFSNNYIDFLKYYSRCYFAFSIKVHGSMLLASMGTPSLLVQLDSRAAVIEALDDVYVNLSTPVDQMLSMCIERIEGIEEYRYKIDALKNRYMKDYDDLFSELGFT